MADITDPAAVKFSNEKIRVMADVLSQSYYSAKQILAEWLALNMAAKITNTADVIVDGAATDGRPVITGAQATNVINRASELITDMEANGNAKLNTVLQVKVNGGSRLS